MDGGTWQSIVRGVAESATTEHISSIQAERFDRKHVVSSVCTYIFAFMFLDFPLVYIIPSHRFCETLPIP